MDERGLATAHITTLRDGLTWAGPMVHHTLATTTTTNDDDDDDRENNDDMKQTCVAITIGE
jgi:hypothetical protein